MTYKQAIDYLFTKRASYEHGGKSGYKPGLDVTLRLSELFGNPHEKFRSIHIAGTNGKGSVAHLIASILMESGMKVGLYTSPHFVDFNERIKVNGMPIPHERVIEFVEDCVSMDFKENPTFFELTTILAFRYFADMQVDVAVIETGLGGRLDSTNILRPDLCVITNVGYDHTDLLGNTLEEIATEKAGIIKENTPVVVGEVTGKVRDVMLETSRKLNSHIVLAGDSGEVRGATFRKGGLMLKSWKFGMIRTPLWGNYQVKNVGVVLECVKVLQGLEYEIGCKAVLTGFANVVKNTGLIGRWTLLNEHPKVICDSGHNLPAFIETSVQLKSYSYKTLRIVIGFMKDKDVAQMLLLLPKSRAKYYFVNAKVGRAMPAETLRMMAEDLGRVGASYGSVAEGYKAARAASGPRDLVFVGGSMYVLAELFAFLEKEKS